MKFPRNYSFGRESTQDPDDTRMIIRVHVYLFCANTLVGENRVGKEARDRVAFARSVSIFIQESPFDSISERVWCTVVSGEDLSG